ncbi:MAG: nucleoside hydrolase [Thermoguttaceae bacterium]|nr:nucleoside hydrolase [Thermoguttaceae bacterium]
MRSAFFVLLIGVCVSLSAYAAEGDLLDVRDTQDSPVKLIFDTDIGGDIDDAFALGLIHSLADRGQCELLGVTLTTASEWAAKFVAAENAVYGRPDIPIGLPEKGTDYNFYPSDTLGQTNADGTPEYPVPDSYKPEDPVALLRRLLAQADDRSVVIVQVGYSTNLANLLDTPGDAVSPLTGKELAAKKVRLVSVMGGAFALDPELKQYAGMREWNIINDIPAAQKLAREWPGEIVFGGSEIGERIRLSSVSLKRDYRLRPAKFLRDAFSWWASKNAPDEGLNHERPAWDLTSVFFVVRPEEGRGYFQLSEPGFVSFDDEGAAAFTPDSNGKHRVFLIDGTNAVRVREAFVNLCSEP